MSRRSSDATADHQLAVVYECPGCEQRFLGERRCPDRQLFCRRIGRGGDRPHYDETDAINDLAHVTTHQEVRELAR